MEIFIIKLRNVSEWLCRDKWAISLVSCAPKKGNFVARSTGGCVIHYCLNLDSLRV